MSLTHWVLTGGQRRPLLPHGRWGPLTVKYAGVFSSPCLQGGFLYQSRTDLGKKTPGSDHRTPDPARASRRLPPHRQAPA